MSSPLAAVLCTALLVLCVGQAVNSYIVNRPQIVDSVKVAIVSKQDDDGKWVNEVKLEHGSEPAPWKVEVEQMTLDRGGRQTVELTATLTGPKPAPQTAASRGILGSAEYFNVAQQPISAPRSYPGSYGFLNQENDQTAVRPYLPLQGGFELPNRSPQVFGPGGVGFPGRGQHINVPAGPHIPWEFWNANRDQQVRDKPDRVGIFALRSVEFHDQPRSHDQQIVEPGRPGILVPGGVGLPNGGFPNIQTQKTGIGYETSWNGSHYFVYNELTDWVAANKSCADADSHLAIVNSEEEASFLSDILSEHFFAHRGAFVGITDEGQEGNWVTVEGVPIAIAGFARWFRSDQPDNENGNENCGSIIPLNGGLNDVPCTSYLLHTICEKEDDPMQIKEPEDGISLKDFPNDAIQESVSASEEHEDVQESEEQEQQEDDEPKPPVGNPYFQTDEIDLSHIEKDNDLQVNEENEEKGGDQPESDYTKFPGFSSSYKVHTKPMDWKTANKTCIEEGAHLAVINSREESNMLQSFLDQDYPYAHRGAFIGITDEAEEGTWLTVFGEPLSKAGFDRFLKFEENIITDEKNDCGAIFPGNGWFIEVPCTDYVMHSICEKDEKESDSIILR